MGFESKALNGNIFIPSNTFYFMVDDNKNYDYVDRAKDERSLFEKITNYIPGYRGYAKQEKIRSTDKMLRESIAGILRECHGNTAEAFELMVNHNEDIVSIDKINLKLDSLIQKVAHAESGYSAFFDPLKVGGGALERMVEFDSSILDIAKTIMTKTSDIKSAAQKNEANPIIEMELLNLIDELDLTFSQRKNYMFELPK